MNKVNFQHKAIVTISNVTLKALVGATVTALVGAIGFAIIAALNVAPKLVYDLDIALGGGI